MKDESFFSFVPQTAMKKIYSSSPKNGRHSKISPNRYFPPCIRRQLRHCTISIRLCRARSHAIPTRVKTASHSTQSRVSRVPTRMLWCMCTMTMARHYAQSRIVSHAWKITSKDFSSPLFSLGVRFSASILTMIPWK